MFANAAIHRAFESSNVVFQGVFADFAEVQAKCFHVLDNGFVEVQGGFSFVYPRLT